MSQEAPGRLEAAGTFEDLTALGEGDDEIGRELKALTSSTQVDDDLAKLRAELGQGDAPKPAAQLEEGQGQ